MINLKYQKNNDNLKVNMKSVTQNQNFPIYLFIAQSSIHLTSNTSFIVSNELMNSFPELMNYL